MTKAKKYVIIIISKEREVKIMRSLHYILSNGCEVKTLAEAEASGQQYKAVMREVKTPFKDSPQMARIRKIKFGID